MQLLTPMLTKPYLSMPPAGEPLILSCVFQEKVQLQYRLTFTMGEQEYSESGGLEQFPPPEKWGNL